MIAAAVAAAARELDDLDDLAKSYGVDIPAATNKPIAAQLTQTSTSAAQEPAQLIPQDSAVKPQLSHATQEPARPTHPPAAAAAILHPIHPSFRPDNLLPGCDLPLAGTDKHL